MPYIDAISALFASTPSRERRQNVEENPPWQKRHGQREEENIFAKGLGVRAERI
jgi:hypothetical protein